jgi:hypothetical protein
VEPVARLAMVHCSPAAELRAMVFNLPVDLLDMVDCSPVVQMHQE